MQGARNPEEYKTLGRSCGKVFIRRRTKRFLYLCNDEGRGEQRRWTFFSSLLNVVEVMEKGLSISHRNQCSIGMVRNSSIGIPLPPTRSFLFTGKVLQKVSMPSHPQNKLLNTLSNFTQYDKESKSWTIFILKAGVNPVGSLQELPHRLRDDVPPAVVEFGDRAGELRGGGLDC
jgi:hypothetical protein